jgi:hypothetical protein
MANDRRHSSDWRVNPLSNPARSRTLVALVWAAVAALVWLAVLTAATLVTAYLGIVVIPRYDGGHPAGYLMFVGAAAGLIGGVWICRHASGWIQRLRLRRLRRRGTAVQARVDQLDVRVFGGRSAWTRYVVRLGWDGYRGIREYRFDGRGRPDFAAALAAGATVTVRYPPGRPHRFVIDVPYSASMVDQFA